MDHIGEIAAFATSFCWTITSLAFEKAGKKVGSYTVNIIRLFIAIIIISIYTTIFRGMVFPTDAPAHAWIWLSVSGFVGFVIGDLLLFESLVRNGSRITMLIMASVPLITSILSYFVLNEIMTINQIIGMLITLLGIVLVIIKKDGESGQIVFSYPIKDLMLAVGGAVGQATGLILSKFGMADYDPIASTQIRVIAAIIGFSLVFTLRRDWHKVKRVLLNIPAMKYIILGSFFGPSLGVSLSLIAVKYTNPGIASTLMSLTPIIIIPFAIFYLKEKMDFKEILGAFVAVFGVAYIFMT
jgi:drug/metabolite transporter (DMT)-like permease